MFPTTLRLTLATLHKSELPGRLHVLPLRVKKRTQNGPVARRVLEAIWGMSRLQPESCYVANDIVIVQVKCQVIVTHYLIFLPGLQATPISVAVHL